MRSLVASACVAWLPNATAAQPSFSCANARSATEKLICDDAQLAALDREQARLYALGGRGAHNERERGELLRSQRAWLRDRNACAKAAHPKPCIAGRTLQRIAEVRTAYAGSRSADDQGSSSGPVALRCEGADFLVGATFVDVDPRWVQLEWLNSRATLHGVPSGSGAKYAGESPTGDASLWTQRDEALLVLPGAPERRCKVERIG